MAVRISGKLIEENRDIILVNVYDSPENSSYKVKQIKSGTYRPTMDSLREFLANIQDGTPYLVAGDFNARTGERCEPEQHGEDLFDALCDGTYYTSSHNTDLQRNSQDPTVNERGRILLDLTREANLKILNGSTIGDVLGKFTCLRYNGNSVIDYMLVENSIQTSISHFEVLDFTDFSDHRPIKCRIRRSSKLDQIKITERFTELPLRYQWDQVSSPESYQGVQNDPSLNAQYEAIRNAACSTPEDVEKLNKDLTKAISDTAELSLQIKKKVTRKRHGRKPAKNKWFDSECIKSRIELRKACKKYCSNPLNELIRRAYYLKRKDYRHLIKRKKAAFYRELNTEIEENHNINWESLKKLQRARSEQNSDLDIYDHVAFYKFFKDLYSKKTITDDKVAAHLRETETLQDAHLDLETDDTLNSEITMDELCKHIKKLKRRKAAAEDRITNELLIYTSSQLREAICKVFNECLNHGVYPWNTALITPLHKKGDKTDPNNYRAIAVGSNLGKLFSSILLDRLISFRQIHCPDPTNQLGFVKDAQTNDHILALSTCLNKYVSGKRRLYACFIDYQKAFDTVCREALMLKLSRIGVRGKFFRCVSHMYRHSTAKVKLLNKISDAIEVLIGTEQGHPMSPELFKTYLIDLSKELNNTTGLNLPELNGFKLSHLLWADDLVLVSLDKKTHQELIDRVHHFCQEWGLTVNIGKTAIMVFNKGGKHLLESRTFKYGDMPIPSARSYCYLGITFNLSGTFTLATDELRKKGLKAYFALKRMIDLTALSPKTVFKLFDALIVPVLSYGSSIWLQNSQFAKALLRHTDRKTKLRQMVSDPMEKMHLKFLKWTLLVHSKCSNMTCYGDSGRYPLFIQLAKQATSYFNRLNTLDAGDDDSLVRHAFAEQRDGKLEWYTNMTKLQEVAGYTLGISGDSRNQIRPTVIQERLRAYFDLMWREERFASNKLAFYNMVKNSETIRLEPFLDLPDYKERKYLMQLRSSSHRFNNETGRYISAQESPKETSSPLWEKRCKFCTSPEAKDFLYLPFAESIFVEDELHALIGCPRYHELRMNLDPDTKSHLLRNEEHWKLFEGQYLTKFARFVKKIWKERFSNKR